MRVEGVLVDVEGFVHQAFRFFRPAPGAIQTESFRQAKEGGKGAYV